MTRISRQYRTVPPAPAPPSAYWRSVSATSRWMNASWAESPGRHILAFRFRCISVNERQLHE